MGRLSGYGRRTVEQTRSTDINRLRRGGCAGGNRLQTGGWARNELYKVGFRPKHWNDDAITLDNQILDIRYISRTARRTDLPASNATATVRRAKGRPRI